MSQCIKTGCRLFVNHGTKSVWGDLHSVGGEAFVFNACLNDRGEADWGYKMIYDLSGGNEATCFVKDSNYFERRGVIVFQDAEFRL